MALQVLLLLTVPIAISMGTSSALTWNPSTHRYESFDLQRGPVFYEAYYPDAKEDTRNYQEKRYFDRGAVLEQSYQLPSNQFYPDNTLQSDYQDPPEASASVGVDYPRSPAGKTERGTFLRASDYNARNDFPLQTADAPVPDKLADDFPRSPGLPDKLDIREMSSIARRAISRDLEDWNVIESYLDRAEHRGQRPIGTPRRILRSDVATANAVGRSTRSQGPLQAGDLAASGFYRENSSGLRNYVQAADQKRIANREYFEDVNPTRFESQRYSGSNSEPGHGPIDRTALLNYREAENSGGILPRNFERGLQNLQGNLEWNSQRDSQENLRSARKRDEYPLENIFEPRPQVLNYVFSKPPRLAEKAMPSAAAKEAIPRSYGDNLIREEIKKAEATKEDVKVASIQVSEEPRHKTRHHHGEWPKRDFSHRTRA